MIIEHAVDQTHLILVLCCKATRHISNRHVDRVPRIRTVLCTACLRFWCKDPSLRIQRLAAPRIDRQLMCITMTAALVCMLEVLLGFFKQMLFFLNATELLQSQSAPKGNHTLQPYPAVSVSFTSLRQRLTQRCSIQILQECSSSQETLKQNAFAKISGQVLPICSCSDSCQHGLSSVSKKASVTDDPAKPQQAHRPNTVLFYAAAQANTNLARGKQENADLMKMCSDLIDQLEAKKGMV